MPDYLLRSCAFFLVCALASTAAWGTTVKFRVADSAGYLVEDAVVFAQMEGSQAQTGEMPLITVDQVDKEFIAYVTPVQVGTTVNFPNRDQIRHHVYSFSAAKTFEIPLYKEMPEEPILFDQPGVVPLGCNIHDWMSAYIYVVDTPYFSITDAKGRCEIQLPAGQYEVMVWHPRLRGQPTSTKQQIQISPTAEQKLANFEIPLKRLWKPRRSPVTSRSGGGGYR